MIAMKRKTNNPNTSWEKASSWYDQAVGDKGHYYHERIIFPKLLTWLSLPEKKKGSLLDLACGQGVLSRLLPSTWEYMGLDLSPSLIQAAKEKSSSLTHQFLIQDITSSFLLEKQDFSFCTIILALQNLRIPLHALQNAGKHLAPGGKLFLIINHPCFRIPQASHWGIDKEKNIQYRRMDSYLSSLRIPIQLHPSQGEKSTCTFSFHHPLSKWAYWLKQADFFIEDIEEWCSDKVSTGKYADREDTSRREFPLFLAIRAVKKQS